MAGSEKRFIMLFTSGQTPSDWGDKYRPNLRRNQPF